MSCCSVLYRVKSINVYVLVCDCFFHTDISVYRVKDAGNEEQEQEFLAEIRLMKVLGRHPNIVNLLGCCTTGTPKFLVVEYAPYGDLLNYLRRRREHVRTAGFDSWFARDVKKS